MGKFDRERGGEWAGHLFYLLAVPFVIVMFKALKASGPSVTTTDLGVTAIVTTVAILFGYGQLAPPSFSPQFEDGI